MNVAAAAPLSMPGGATAPGGAAGVQSVASPSQLTPSTQQQPGPSLPTQRPGGLPSPQHAAAATMPLTVGGAQLSPAGTVGQVPSGVGTVNGGGLLGTGVVGGAPLLSVPSAMGSPGIIPGSGVPGGMTTAPLTPTAAPSASTLTQQQATVPPLTAIPSPSVTPPPPTGLMAATVPPSSSLPVSSPVTAPAAVANAGGVGVSSVLPQQNTQGSPPPAGMDPAAAAAAAAVAAAAAAAGTGMPRAQGVPTAGATGAQVRSWCILMPSGDIPWFEVSLPALEGSL